MRYLNLLFLLLFSSIAMAKPMLVDKYLPLEGFNPPMKCDPCRIFSVEDDMLKIKGYGSAWTQSPSYDVTGDKKVIVELKARLHTIEYKGKERGAELVIGFSQSLKKDERLIFKIGCRQEARVKSVVRLNRKYIARNRYILPPDSWEPIKILLTDTELLVTASGIELIRADLVDKDFPKTGHVGILADSHGPLEIKDFTIRQE